MSQEQKVKNVTVQYFAEKLEVINGRMQRGEWDYEMTLESVFKKVFEDVEEPGKKQTGQNKYMSMLRIRQNVDINNKYFPALESIKFTNEISDITVNRFDKSIQDSSRVAKLNEYFHDLEKHEKKLLKQTEESSEQQQDSQFAFFSNYEDTNHNLEIEALQNFQFIERIYPYISKEMGKYNELQERKQILNRLDGGQMLHRRSMKNFVMSYLLLILTSHSNIHKYQKNLHNLSFRKEYYMTQKIEHNFLTLKEKKYQNQFENQQEIFLFQLICTGITLPAFLKSLWILFKIHYVRFNWRIIDSEREKLIATNRQTSLKGLKMNNITFLKIFQGTLLDHIEMFQPKKYQLDNIKRNSSYSDLRIMDDSKMEKCQYIELKVPREEKKLGMLKKQANEIIKNSFSNIKLVQEQGVQQHFSIYLNPYLFNDQYIQRKAFCIPNYIDSRQTALHKCFKVLSNQNKQKFNNLHEAYTFLQCESMHIFCFVFKKAQNYDEVKQFSKKLQHLQIKRISGQKKTLDFKSEYGAFEIIKAIIVYIDNDSVQWGQERASSVQPEFEKNLFEHLLHQIREEKHMIYLTSGLPTQKIIQGTQSNLNFSQIETFDRISRAKLSQKYFNIYLGMLERERVKTSNPVLQATTIFIVQHSQQFLQSNKIKLEQQKAAWLPDYEKKLLAHIWTMRGHGITSLRLNKYEKLMNDLIQPKIENCQQIYQFMDESFKEFEMEPIFSSYNSFWKYLNISIKIILKGKQNNSEIDHILKRQQTMCIIYNLLGEGNFSVKNEVIWLEVYLLAITYGVSLDQRQSQEIGDYVKQPLNFIIQLASVKIIEIENELSIKPLEEAKQLFGHLYQQLRRLSQKITEGVNPNVKIFCKERIYEIQKECKDCNCCELLKPFHGRRETCYQRFALLARMIQEKCIYECEQTEKKLSDKLLMQKYKAIMTKAYSLNSQLLQ